MSRPLKIVSVMIAMLLLVEPAFANPIIVSPFQVTNPALAVQTLCKPKIALGAFCAPGAVYYDSLNRLTAIQDQGGAAIASYSYDPLSRRTGVALANGITTNYGYDNVNRLVSMANKVNGGANISTFGYSYDSVGNRLSKTTAAVRKIL